MVKKSLSLKPAQDLTGQIIGVQFKTKHLKLDLIAVFLNGANVPLAVWKILMKLHPF